MGVPLKEVDLGQEIVHGLRLTGEKALIQIAGIPFQQDPAEVENDGFYGSRHAGDFIRFLSALSGA